LAPAEIKKQAKSLFKRTCREFQKKISEFLFNCLFSAADEKLGAAQERQTGNAMWLDMAHLLRRLPVLLVRGNSFTPEKYTILPESFTPQKYDILSVSFTPEKYTILPVSPGDGTL
jgi:hypothetical protein